MSGEDLADGLGASARSATLAVALPEQLIAETLARLLGTQGLHVVGWYCALNAVLEKLRRCRPRIVVVDPAVGGADDAGLRARTAPPRVGRDAHRRALPARSTATSRTRWWTRVSAR